jgi:hypothetical protein
MQVIPPISKRTATLPTTIPTMAPVDKPPVTKECYFLTVLTQFPLMRKLILYSTVCSFKYCSYLNLAQNLNYWDMFKRQDIQRRSVE